MNSTPGLLSLSCYDLFKFLVVSMLCRWFSLYR